ncbi:MAG TPA: kynureninase, partial [Flavobacteriales bacterium]|nr:kynureninase [Flavobacteriales bacterium]
LKLDLHGWNTDFACWCSYKYLNSGPGSVAGAFVHERHHREKLPRFAGWWGHDKNERFLMEPEFKPMASAEAWQLSNAPVFSMAVHRAALDLFDRAGMDALRAKSEELTGYLAFVLKTISAAHGDPFTIITPDDPAQRGCQLSLLVRENGRALFDTLTRNGVVVDWREPDPSTSLRAGVIRMAPVPLYNSFEDVFRFGGILDNALRS